ncbi:amino acid transporter [Phaffia rhodozyma]|uniref:Amino acid transporter n=1 Tax=Phaffia rhodozyma TaxID=264483 RepID=A0A0F7SNG9_PHARH|nr:amino acid transporter [Phaffia rhodozyma]
MPPWSREAGDERVTEVELKKKNLTLSDGGSVEKKGDSLPTYEDTVVIATAQQAGSSIKNEQTVQRKLKARHLSMIALGGTIGTGLFVGAGGALAAGGPVGCLLGYSIMGLVAYSMMVALGGS